MNWKRLGIGIIIIVLLAAGGYWVYAQFLAPPADNSQNGPAGDQIAAEEVDLNIVSAEGQIVPLNDALLSFQLGGEIQEILA
ncbi:MAG TPA: hypothetical protein ENK32_00340, partial [Anaerolineae bacterium]|nr:hypothetical protein [Anaerolineae bacterium]